VLCPLLFSLLALLLFPPLLPPCSCSDQGLSCRAGDFRTLRAPL